MIRDKARMVIVTRDSTQYGLKLNSDTALTVVNDPPHLISHTSEKVLEKPLLNSLKAQSALHEAMS